ncbi:hypothetical protein M885DRAFT_612781 [Pelagophyceae sp. CCMP2097]|nr:hypothetical protein M885DRAFT_612781 [Pelagophyceae sp. CCMP2097]
MVLRLLAVAASASAFAAPFSHRRSALGASAKGADEKRNDELEFILSDYTDEELEFDDEEGFDAAMMERGWAEHAVYSDAPLPWCAGSVADAVRNDGAAAVRKALSEPAVEALRLFVDSQLAEAVDLADDDEAVADERFSSVLCPGDELMTRFDLRLDLEPAVWAAFRELFAGPVGAGLADLVGDDAELWEVAAFISEPGAPPQPLHADTLFSDGACLYTTLVALQDVRVDMGPTRFVLNTHVDEEAHDEIDFGSVAFLESRKESTRAALLGAGDAAVYDGRCMHAGGANLDAVGETRRLFYFTFLRPGADADELGNPDAHSILPHLRGMYALRDLRGEVP